MDHDEVREQPMDIIADADLVLRTRSGDTGAFAELWRRHYRAGVTVARNMTPSLDADDLVQEAYTRIYHSIVNGGGPTGSFRAYLFTSIRNTAAAWGRARRETTYDDLDGLADPWATEHESEAALDRSLTHRAFRSLPSRWQEVLWYSEIERMKPAEIAPLLGMKPTAVAQLTFRAREGLREAWIQAHLRRVTDGSECEWTIERLGAYNRQNLGRRDHAKLERHLASCVRCSIVASEAKEVSSRLALVLLPLALGAVGTAGYLATVQGGGAPLVALAAMPSGMVHGTVTAAPAGLGSAAAGSAGVAATTTGAAAGSVGGTAAAGSGLGAGAAIGSSAGVAGAAATAVGTTTAAATTAGGSVLAGIGAASGIAAASLVVVGGVVAAATLPAAAPEPVPTKTINSTVAPADFTAATDGAEDSVLLLSDDPGPGPADIPGFTDVDFPGAGEQGASRSDGSTGNGQGSGGKSAVGNGTSGNGQTSTNTGSGSTGNGETNGTAGNGQNAGGGAANTASGDSDDQGDSAGDRDSRSGGNGNPSTGDRPTNGTGNGNGGDTGNAGATGNGTPTNGTGNGNGGNTGGANGNGAAQGKANGTTRGGKDVRAAKPTPPAPAAAPSSTLPDPAVTATEATLPAADGQ